TVLSSSNHLSSLRSTLDGYFQTIQIRCPGVGLRLNRNGDDVRRGGLENQKRSTSLSRSQTRSHHANHVGATLTTRLISICASQQTSCFQRHATFWLQ